MKAKIINLPDNYESILDEFKHGFSKPAFKYFKEFIKGILLCKKSTVTNFFLIGAIYCHFASYHKFLYRYKWFAVKISFCFLSILMKTFKPQEIAFAVDNTITPKYGKKIFGRGLHFDHAAKENFAKYIKGHNWIVLGFFALYSGLFEMDLFSIYD